MITIIIIIIIIIPAPGLPMLKPKIPTLEYSPGLLAAVLSVLSVLSGGADDPKTWKWLEWSKASW